MVWKETWHLLREMVDEWGRDSAARLAAALAFYIIFSLAPLLVIAIAVAGAIFNRAAVRNEIFDQFERLVGADGAVAVRTMVENVRMDAGGTFATTVGIALSLFAASRVFLELQEALNTVWGVRTRPGSGIMGLLKKRLFSFAMVVSTGLYLLVTLLLNAGVAAATRYFAQFLPDATWLIQGGYYVFLVCATTLIFGLIYKYLPDAIISWRSVGFGALVTAILFTLGQVLLGFYLGRGTFTSAYGAAGSFVLVVMWVYFSCQILLMGAEFTQVRARRSGTPIRPAPNAYSVWERSPTGEMKKRSPEQIEEEERQRQEEAS